MLPIFDVRCVHRPNSSKTNIIQLTTSFVLNSFLSAGDIFLLLTLFSLMLVDVRVCEVIYKDKCLLSEAFIIVNCLQFCYVVIMDLDASF